MPATDWECWSWMKTVYLAAMRKIWQISINKFAVTGITRASSSGRWPMKNMPSSGRLWAPAWWRPCKMWFTNWTRLGFARWQWTAGRKKKPTVFPVSSMFRVSIIFIEATWTPFTNRIQPSPALARRRPAHITRAEFTRIQKPINRLTMTTSLIMAQPQRNGGRITMRDRGRVVRLFGLVLIIGERHHHLTGRISVPNSAFSTRAVSRRTYSIITSPGGRKNRSSI